MDTVIQIRENTMEFHVRVGNAAPDIDALDAAFRAMDPAAVVDFDAAHRHLRISAALGAADIGRVLVQAGYPIELGVIEPQPSVCCGGCSG